MKLYDVYSAYFYKGRIESEYLGRTDDDLSGFRNDLLAYPADPALVPGEAVKSGRPREEDQQTYYLVPVSE